MRTINAKMSYDERQRWAKKSQRNKQKYLKKLREGRRKSAPPSPQP